MRQISAATGSSAITAMSSGREMSTSTSGTSSDVVIAGAEHMTPVTMGRTACPVVAR